MGTKRFKIYEKNNSVGGTWTENRYPGCRVDIANHFYSYSFEENHQWSEYFSKQPELEEYFQKCFTKYQLAEITQFNTEVSSMTFNDSSNMWTVQSKSDGQEYGEVFNLKENARCWSAYSQSKTP